MIWDSLTLQNVLTNSALKLNSITVVCNLRKINFLIRFTWPSLNHLQKKQNYSAAPIINRQQFTLKLEKITKYSLASKSPHHGEIRNCIFT